MKKIVLLLVLCVISKGYCQKLTEEEVINSFVLEDFYRSDRFKKTDKIEKAEIYFYLEGVDTLNLAERYLANKNVLLFNTYGKVKRKIFEGGIYKTFFTYIYDDKQRVIKRMDSTLYGKKMKLDGYSLYKYNSNSIEKIKHIKDEPISKIIFTVENGVVKSYKDEIGDSRYLHIEFDRIALSDFHDYIEGINISKENFENLSEDRNSYEFEFNDTKLVLSNGVFTKTNYIYKNDLLQQKKELEKRYKTNAITNYTYDAYGNWITKTELDRGMLIRHIVRKIYYK